MENEKIDVMKLGKVATEAGIELGWRARDHNHTLEETIEEFREIWDGGQEQNEKPRD